jgi:hypothetical protein
LTAAATGATARRQPPELAVQDLPTPEEVFRVKR